MSYNFFPYDDRGNFDMPKALEWMGSNSHIPVIAVTLYLLFVYFGRRWMKDRPAFKAKWSLTAWNTMLAVFSLLCLINVLPNFVTVITAKGAEESMCKLSMTENPNIGMWMILFIYSKILELGDTVFIVLRKSHLQFLHWYHHITVLLYSWFAITAGMQSAGYWFATINVSVHVLMYSYYTIRSVGIHVPSKIALCITVLQILQMFQGLYVNYVHYKFHALGRTDCFFDWKYFFITSCLYGSYAVLFLRFLCNRYVLKEKEKNI